MDYDVKDLSLAEAGKARFEWADKDMPVLASLLAAIIERL